MNTKALIYLIFEFKIFNYPNCPGGTDSPNCPGGPSGPGGLGGPGGPGAPGGPGDLLTGS